MSRQASPSILRQRVTAGAGRAGRVTVDVSTRTPPRMYRLRLGHAIQLMKENVRRKMNKSFDPLNINCCVNFGGDMPIVSKE